MDRKQIIEKYIEFAEKSINIDILEDKNAVKYNKIGKKIYDIIVEIREDSSYKEIFMEILTKLEDEKYWQIHYDLAESLYLKDKLFSLEIYKIHKGRAMADSRIKELENELRDEGKLAPNTLLGKIFN